MAIPEDVRSDAETALAEFCAEHSSAGEAAQVRYAYQFESSAALLMQQRPGFMRPDEWVASPMAKFRYSQARNEWSLYWIDSNERWQRVTNVKAEKDIRKLLAVVVSDPLGVFWS
jgi:DUF3024 family protein